MWAHCAQLRPTNLGPASEIVSKYVKVKENKHNFDRIKFKLKTFTKSLFFIFIKIIPMR